MLDWTSAVPPALLELTLKGWINVAFIALIVLIAAVAAILGRVPQSRIGKIQEPRSLDASIARRSARSRVVETTRSGSAPTR